MGLVVIGLSHQTAPVELREHMSVGEDRLADLLTRLKTHEEVQEAVIVSTCNRFEVYARPTHTRPRALEAVTRTLSDLYQRDNLEPLLYRHEGELAVRHLFRVACGLDSLVIGETEILGQVKASYLRAQSLAVTGKITNVLFQRALYVGKHVRTHTALSEGASSVGSVAVQLAEKIFGRLDRHRVLLIGAGKMAEVTARHLLSQKAGDITILNRTESRAADLARILQGRSGPLEKIDEELSRADIVICSAGADGHLISRSQVEAAMERRRGRSLYFIDIAVPRNVDPAVNDIDNAYVYNIDALRALVEGNLDRRRADVAAVEDFVAKRASEFYEWVRAELEGRSAALRHTVDPARP